MARSSDPRLSLFEVTDANFQRLVGGLCPAASDYLSVLEDRRTRDGFADPFSTFDADEFTLGGIERRPGEGYDIAVDLYLAGEPYARPTDTVGVLGGEVSAHAANHLVVVTQDGPPALMHSEYYGSIHNAPGDLPLLLAGMRAEILGLRRAAALAEAIGRLTVTDLSRDSL